jgi:hypothetical protein
MLEEYDILCPYCGEVFTTTVDLSAGDQQYIEDCQVCCNPIVFSINMDMHGGFTVQTRRDNE